MAIQMNIAEAKAKLSALVDAALVGEDVVLARNGRPTVKLVPVAPLRARRMGLLRNMGWTGDVSAETFAPEPEDAIEPDIVDRP